MSPINCNHRFLPVQMARNLFSLLRILHLLDITEERNAFTIVLLTRMHVSVFTNVVIGL